METDWSVAQLFVVKVKFDRSRFRPTPGARVTSTSLVGRDARWIEALVAAPPSTTARPPGGVETTNEPWPCVIVAVAVAAVMVPLVGEERTSENVSSGLLAAEPTTVTCTGMLVTLASNLRVPLLAM